MLKPNGILYVYVPAFQALYSTFDRKVGHLRRYRRGELAAMVTRAGFRVEKAAYRDSLGFLAALVFKLVARDDGHVGRATVLFYDRFVFPVSRLLDRVLGLVVGKNLVIVASK